MISSKFQYITFTITSYNHSVLYICQIKIKDIYLISYVRYEGFDVTLPFQGA